MEGFFFFYNEINTCNFENLIIKITFHYESFRTFKIMVLLCYYREMLLFCIKKKCQVEFKGCNSVI